MKEEISWSVAEKILIEYRVPPRSYTIEYWEKVHIPNRVIFNSDIAKYVPKVVKSLLKAEGYDVIVNK